MEQFEFSYPATRKVPKRSHVGVVGSGDLEVLFEPAGDAAASVRVRTSADGFKPVSSYVVLTREARLGLNGPEVIEEESGVEEFDASDCSLIWSIVGGEQCSGLCETRAALQIASRFQPSKPNREGCLSSFNYQRPK